MAVHVWGGAVWLVMFGGTILILRAGEAVFVPIPVSLRLADALEPRRSSDRRSQSR